MVHRLVFDAKIDGSYVIYDGHIYILEKCERHLRKAIDLEKVPTGLFRNLSYRYMQCSTIWKKNENSHCLKYQINHVKWFKLVPLEKRNQWADSI